jgi:catechol 2,3-dioxygenase-like lactoylglutathione lyase family enzyme
MNWLDHVGIVVSDLQAASRFYTSLFNSPVLETGVWRGANAAYLGSMLGRPSGFGLEASYVRIPHMNSLVELLHYTGLAQTHVQPAPTDIGALHLGLYVDAADLALARLGQPTTGAVTSIPYGPCKGGKTAYLRDPDGANIQFMQLDRRPGGLPILKGADGWIDHLGMVVTDLDVSLDFYTRLLEAPITHRQAWRGRDADYVAAMLGRPPGMELEAGHIQIPHTNSLLELIQYSGIEQGRLDVAPSDVGAIHLGLSVDSAEDTVARMKVPSMGGVVDIPNGPSRGGRTAYLRDPDGVSIQLMELARRPGNLPILTRSLPQPAPVG